MFGKGTAGTRNVGANLLEMNVAIDTWQEGYRQAIYPMEPEPGPSLHSKNAAAETESLHLIFIS